MPRRSQKIFLIFFSAALVHCTSFCPAGAGAVVADSPDEKEYERISALINEGALLPARTRVELLVARYPANWRVSLLAARLYRKMGLSGFAAMQYEKVRAHDPRMVEALVALSEIHLENLSTEIAIVLARQAVEIDPRSKEARQALVEALLAGQFLRQARDQAQTLNSMYPSDADVAHTQASVAQAFGQYDVATAMLLRALATRPEKINWRLELADIYQAQGQYAACYATLKQVLEAEPHMLEALNKIAHLQEFDMHDYMPAFKTYRSIKEIIPDSATAQAGMDRCFAKQSDLALNVRNAFYRVLGIKNRNAKLEESTDLPVSF